MKHWIVYVITCNAPGPNHGRQYVGQCKADGDGSSRRRWKQHVTYSRHDMRPLYVAIRTDGAGAFAVEDIACSLSRRDATALENTITISLNTHYPNGLNLGGSPADRTRDPQLRNERRAFAKAGWERRKANGTDKVVLTPEARQHRVAALKASWMRPEVAAKRAAGISAAWAKPGARDRRVAAMREAYQKPDIKARRAAAVSKWQSKPEMKPILSARAKDRWANKTPEERKAWLAKGINSPEEIAKTTRRLVEGNRRRAHSDWVLTHWDSENPNRFHRLTKADAESVLGSSASGDAPVVAVWHFSESAGREIMSVYQHIRKHHG